MDNMIPTQPASAPSPSPMPTPPASSSKSFFDLMNAKQGFVLGCVTTILVLGTLGFVSLGAYILHGGGGLAFAAAPTSAPAANAAPVAAAAAPVAAAVSAKNIPAVTAADHVRGDAKASVTIVEYSDFQCPYCGAFHPTLQQVMTDYAGKVKWVYRHFPLSNIHPNAEPAAEASECASEQGKFWEFADTLFANQSSESDAYYKTVAGNLGLDVNKFESCYTAKKYSSVIQADQAGGSAAGVNGTPGSFIIDAKGNAQAINGALPYASVKQMIDTALNS